MTTHIIEGENFCHKIEAEGFHIDEKGNLNLVRNNLIIAVYKNWDCIYEDYDD